MKTQLRLITTSDSQSGASATQSTHEHLPAASAQPQVLSYSTDVAAGSNRISSLVGKGFDLTAVAGTDGKLIASFTRGNSPASMNVIEIENDDPGISHAYRLSTNTLQHVAHNGNSWVFAYLPQKIFRSQNVIKCRTLECLLAQIKSYWKREYRITSIAHGKGYWVAVGTRHNTPREQSFFTASDSESLQEKTRAAWEEGRRITAITYGEGKWLVILEKETDITAQKWLTRKGFVDLRTKIREEWSRGFEVTSLARGAGVWLVVLSKRKLDFSADR